MRHCIYAGYRFDGPAGQAYELTQDLHEGDLILASHFRALNGAPEPKDHEPMPAWLVDELSATPTLVEAPGFDAGIPVG